MDQLLYGIWVTLEGAAIFLFLSATLPTKGRMGKAACWFLPVWGLACAIRFTLGQYLPDWGREALTISAIILFSLWSFQGSPLRKALFSILSFVFCGIFDAGVLYGFCALLGISMEALAGKRLLYAAAGSVSKVCTVLFAYLLWQYRRWKEPVPIKGQWVLLSTLFPAVSLVNLSVLFFCFQDRADLPLGIFLYTCLLMAANLAILYVLSVLERQSQRQKQMLLMAQQMDLLNQNFSALEKSYRAQRRASHEYQHQIDTVAELLGKNDHASALAYVRQLQNRRASCVFAVNCGNPILDAVLNQKYQLARENGIDLQVRVNDLSKVTLDPAAIVTILSNLLDNAIEACQKLPSERFIECTLLAEEELYLSVRNTSLPVAPENMETTKEPKWAHGLGLPNVKSALSNLNATYAMEYADGWFQFAAEIPNCFSEKE